jgi:hypothetical protein
MSLVERPTALAPKGGVQIGRNEDGVRHAPRTEAGGAVLLFPSRLGPVRLCLWSQASI